MLEYLILLAIALPVSLIAVLEVTRERSHK